MHDQLSLGIDGPGCSTEWTQMQPEARRAVQESARRQYGRVDWALASGWRREQIVVVDDDQGVSGSLPRSRPGFERLATAVVAGEVGVVIGCLGHRHDKPSGGLMTRPPDEPMMIRYPPRFAPMLTARRLRRALPGQRRLLASRSAP